MRKGCQPLKGRQPFGRVRFCKLNLRRRFEVETLFYKNRKRIDEEERLKAMYGLPTFQRLATLWQSDIMKILSPQPFYCTSNFIKNVEWLIKIIRYRMRKGCQPLKGWQPYGVSDMRKILSL